jgi:alpha-glucosidase
MQLTIGKREGTYPAWWKQIHLEIYGWTPSKNEVLVNGTAAATGIGRVNHGTELSIPDDGNPATILVR